MALLCAYRQKIHVFENVLLAVFIGLCRKWTCTIYKENDHFGTGLRSIWPQLILVHPVGLYASWHQIYLLLLTLALTQWSLDIFTLVILARVTATFAWLALIPVLLNSTKKADYKVRLSQEVWRLQEFWRLQEVRCLQKARRSQEAQNRSGNLMPCTNLTLSRSVWS